MDEGINSIQNQIRNRRQRPKGQETALALAKYKDMNQGQDQDQGQDREHYREQVSEGNDRQQSSKDNNNIRRFPGES